MSIVIEEVVGWDPYKSQEFGGLTRDRLSYHLRSAIRVLATNYRAATRKGSDERKPARYGGTPLRSRGWNSASRWAGREGSSSENRSAPALAASIPSWWHPGGC